MRVAFVTSVISKTLGGIQNTGYYFSKVFPDSIEFEAFCSTESELEGIDCKICKSKYKSNNTIKYHVDILKMLFTENKKNKYEFTFAALYPMALECFLLKKIKKIPYGVMMHGNELLDGIEPKTVKQKCFRKLRFAARRTILNNADILFANSEYTKKLCELKSSNHNIKVIHPPICFEDRDCMNYAKSKILFSLGRIERRKGFQYVVEAMENLVKVIPDLKYYIAGTGPFENELKSLINEKKLNDNVLMLGKISEEEKDLYYKKCDYFIMPSFVVEEDSSVEGFGIVFIEANMYGKYVVTTRSGGIPDAIRESVTGSFVKTKNSQSIVDMVSYLYSQEFSYSPEACKAWAEQMDIINIVNQYIYNFTLLLSPK